MPATAFCSQDRIFSGRGKSAALGNLGAKNASGPAHLLVKPISRMSFAIFSISDLMCAANSPG